MITHKAIIVDDEPHAREIIKDLLASYCPGVQVTGEAGDAESALALLQTATFDILFLDINLGKKSGFDLLDKLSRERSFHLVFVTAYEQYALTAFQYEALHYIVKPVTKEDLLRTMERIGKQGSNPDIVQHTLKLLQQLQVPNDRKIIVPGKTGWDVINTGEIIYLEADKSYTKIFIEDGRQFYSSKNLKHYMELLDGLPQFIRVHKSYIVSKDHIVKIIKSTGHIVTSNEAVIPLSEDMKPKVYNLFNI